MAERTTSEPNQRLCRYCGRHVGWRATGERQRDGSWVRVDARGARWAGRRCPDCERARVSAAVRCDSFERMQVVRRLEDDGYTVQGTTLPLNVTKDGQDHTVSVRRAYVEGTRVVIEEDLAARDDLVALVFTSVRVMSADQLRRMGDNLVVHTRSKKMEKSSGVDPKRSEASSHASHQPPPASEVEL